MGTIAIGPVNRQMRDASVGYSIGEAFKGRGLATAALKLVVQKVREHGELRKLIATVAAPHAGSCRVLEKCGFEQEGLMRGHWVLNGIVFDVRLFGLLFDR